MKFSDLELEPSLFKAIENLGFSEATQIQKATIPHIHTGRDVSGLAQTGTGKTAAFLIPLMDRVLKGKINHPSANKFKDWKSQNFILILVPTRELAEQVTDNIAKLGQGSGLTFVSVYGGTGYEKQKEAFRQHVDFVVATPGRLIDLYKENCVDLKQVRAIVFDEADRMFDMGFKDDMKYILQRAPRDRQILLFSATLNFDVVNTAYQFGAEPVEIDVSRDQAKAENVRDEIFHVGHEDKPKYLLSILKKYNPRQVIIFSNFKLNVEKIANFLNQNDIPAMAISSLLSQSQRNRVLELFKADNEKNILVATDVAARGLDIKGVDMVINFELPNDAESYVHRIGRTGRAGAEGHAYSLVSDRDVESLERIESYLKHKLQTGWLEDKDIVSEMKPFPDRDVPVQQTHGGGGGGQQRRNDRRPRHPRQDQQRSKHPRHNPKGNSRQEFRGGDQKQQPGSQNRPQRSQEASGDFSKNKPRHHHQKHQRPQKGSQQEFRNPSRRRPLGEKRPSGRQTPEKTTSVVQKVSSFLKNLFK